MSEPAYPPDVIMRQLLSEAPNAVVATVIGCTAEHVPRIRRRWKINDPWTGHNQAGRRIAVRILEQRWYDYPNTVPAPVELRVLKEAVQRAMGSQTAVDKRMGAQPVTVGRITVEVRAFQRINGRWPNPDELGDALGNPPGYRNALRLAHHHSMLDISGGQVRPHEIAQANEVRVSCMTPEDIAKYGPPRNPVEAGRIRDLVIGMCASGGTTATTTLEKATLAAERAAANHTYVPGATGRYREA